ncbi:hypothetical protein Tco_1319642 [Tanacetum coccineum]
MLPPPDPPTHAPPRAFSATTVRRCRRHTAATTTPTPYPRHSSHHHHSPPPTSPSSSSSSSLCHPATTPIIVTTPSQAPPQGAFGCVNAPTVYIHNHKDYLGKFDEKADDGYFLRYSLVSKASRVFNTRRQQTEETYHIIFDESTNAIKSTKPLVDNINIAESERYPPHEPEPVVLETEVPSDQNDQTDLNDHNDHPAQTDEIFNDN